MASTITWISIGILLLFLSLGLLIGLVRGLKRSALHLIFFAVSIVVAFFITKPIVNAILGIVIPFEGENIPLSEVILKFIQSNFDMTSLPEASDFVKQLPGAIASPILFIVLALACYGIFEIIYLIVARVSFGKKKTEFKTKKPYRAYGAIVGLVEGFLLMFIIFAPLTSLTNTYAEISQLPPAQSQQLETGNNPENGGLQTVGEMLSGVIPSEFHEMIMAYNNGVVGKISGAVGIDNLLFDGLSNFEMEGEKIEFRKEILSAVDVYNEVVLVSKDLSAGNTENLDLTDLKQNITTLLDNGLFKVVISNTIQDVVLNFDSIMEDLKITNLPTIVEDIVTELKTAFSVEGFDIHAYLKADIINAVDVFDAVLKNDLIDKYNAIETLDFVSVLEFIKTNNDAVSSIATDALSLNLVKDCFTTLGKLASDEISKFLKNDQNLEIALNTEIEDKDKMIEDVLGAIDDFLALNDIIDIPALLEATDIVDTITSIENLDEALTSVGTTFDALRNLEILVLPETQTREEKIYVFDNILKLYDLELLKDEVYLTANASEKTPLNTYSLFFTYLKSAIIPAKNLGLTDIGKEGVTFKTILNKILVGLEIKEDILSDILLPFYQLTAMDLNTLVFDEVVAQLSDSNNTNGLISFADAKTEADADLVKGGVEVWDREFKLIGKTLKALNKGAIEKQGQAVKLTYLDALLDGTIEYDVVLKAMINDDKTSTDNILKDVLDPVFTAVSFEGLTNKIFENIDNSIKDLTTKITIKSDLTNLKTTKTNVIETLETLLDITLNNDEITLQHLGQILDVLKVNAKNGGTKDGVFNEIFANIIYYMTGDNITETANKFTGAEKHENSADVKAYLDVTDVENGYYNFASYENAMLELEDVVAFVADLEKNLPSTITDDNLLTYVEKFKETVDGMTEKTETEKAKVLDNLKKLIDADLTDDREPVLTEEQKTTIHQTTHMTYGNMIIEAIDDVQSGFSEEVKVALKNLLGLSA